MKEDELLISIPVENRTLEVVTNTGNLGDLKSAGALITSFAEGSPPTKGSLGTIINAFNKETGQDLVKFINGSSDLISGEGLPSGMLIGCIDTLDVVNSIFARLCIVQLPSVYNQDALSMLYNALKMKMNTILFGTDGSLTMPLVGSHPGEGVMPSDVFEEILSLLIYCATKINDMHTIRIVLRADALAELKRKLFNPSMTVEGSDMMNDLLPQQTEKHIEYMKKLYDEQYNFNNCITESLGNILTQWKLCKEHLNDEKICHLFISLVCIQGRRVLECFCRLVSGDRRMNAGFRQIEDLFKSQLINLELCELARKVVKNGNKVAHTDTYTDTLTLVDANSTLICISTIVERMKQPEFEQIIQTQQNQKLSFFGGQNEGGFKLLSGDWICSSCNHHNFASRVLCQRCNQPKPQNNQNNQGERDENSNQRFQSQNQGQDNQNINQRFIPSQNQQGVKMLPGDWLCQHCGCHNFQSRYECFKCRQPKS